MIKRQMPTKAGNVFRQLIQPKSLVTYFEDSIFCISYCPITRWPSHLNLFGDKSILTYVWHGFIKE